MTHLQAVEVFPLAWQQARLGYEEFVLVSNRALVLAFFQSLDASHKILSAIDKEVG